jgi:hypothetical protein
VDKGEGRGETPGFFFTGLTHLDGATQQSIDFVKLRGDLAGGRTVQDAEIFGDV